jgi:membrane-bound inhibitor of C-type lysozyme
MRRAPLALALALLAPLPAAAGDGAVTELRYTCERGVEVPAAYVNAGAVSVAVILVEGRMVALPVTQSASGARYSTAAKGRSGYTWWTKGDDAQLSWFDAERSEEVTLLAFCTADAPS